MAKEPAGKVRITIKDGQSERSYLVSPDEAEILHQLATIYASPEEQRLHEHGAELRRLLRKVAQQKLPTKLLGLWSA